MDEDDLDFTPTQGTSSNLASLFGYIKTPPQGNSSLIYTAPKAPKKGVLPENLGKPAGQITYSKAVMAYKLVNGSYATVGLAGILISANHTFRIYDLILYNPTKEVLTKIRITRSFSFTVAVNNYLSFYDNNNQNWSVMFKSPTDVQEFIEKLSISKFYSHPKPPECLLIQDLTPASQSQTQTNSVVEVKYSSFELKPGDPSVIESEIKEKVNLSENNIPPLNHGLIGCWEKCKRLIIAPHSLSGFWMSGLDETKDLMLVVEVEKITTESKVLEPKSNLTEEGPESPVESSAEESSIKARGVSIKEALTSTKSQKANLISRMARMGQATLPVREQSLSGGPSDSEEEVPMTSSPKPRVPRGRGSSSNSHQAAPTMSQTTQNPEALKQISVYQNDLMRQQSQLGKVGVIHQQLVPLSASPIVSPTTDPSLSVYISESRIQATELRMGLSKVSEKLDLVWNKLQNANLSSSENKSHQPGLVDTTGILSNIQNLLTENENLRAKVEEQKGKIEQQNDRIFQLLELNHKYLEQNSTSYDKQSESENKLKTETERLRKKEIQLEEDNKKYSEKVMSLERDLEKAEIWNKELAEKVDELKGDLERLKRCSEGNDSAMKKEMENYEEKMTKASESMAVLKERLKQVVAENEKLKLAIGTQTEELEAKKIELEESRKRKEECEMMVESLKGKLMKRSESESKMEELEKENKSLSIRIEKEKKDKDEEVKKVLRQLSTTLKDQFSDSNEYSGSTVLSTISRCFNDAVNGCPPDNPPVKERKGGVDDSKTHFASPEDSIVVPEPRTSLMKPETSSKGSEGNKSTKEPPEKSDVSSDMKPEDEKDKKNEGGKKENVDNRYKSYDQSWRTTKPPPPPLFDDEDDDDDWLN